MEYGRNRKIAANPAKAMALTIKIDRVVGGVLSWVVIR